MKKKGLGFAPDPFKLAIEKYGIWPMTVWDCDFSDLMLKRLKKEIGDGILTSERKGSGNLGYQTKRTAREGCSDHSMTYKKAMGGSKITESIFNPIVAIWVLNLFGPPQGGTVYDPFGGGGTRAIVSSKKKLNYVGMEIRQEEVDAVGIRLKENEVNARIICGDSRNVFQILDQSADFLMTCPPYYDMEKYQGGENDLSMSKTYSEFLQGIEQVVRESWRILKPGALSCWVVGLHRGKDGELLSIPNDIVKIHKQNGFFHKEEIILYWNKNTTGAIQRVGSFEKGNRFLIRCHEYLEVFVRKNDD